MSDVAIRVEGLGKRYRIGERKAAYNTLRDRLSGAFAGSLGGLRNAFSRNGHGNNGNRPDHFWALKDVSFEIKHGEVVGVIGRNGAGKSTLLKLLSRITEPTAGRATIHGRVGSLLEVGTGFHPELTGRENIYMNGAILGMSRADIARRFDEIVAFAQVERFLDTPIKRYSSGMQLRLGFSVAAHLEPDILIVDEVLAVGDVAFQKKCLNKMQGVASSGRCVLLVSHNMTAIERLSNRACYLDAGTLKAIGDTHDVVSDYLNLSDNTLDRTSLTKEDLVQLGCRDRIQFSAFTALQPGSHTSPFRNDLPIQIAIDYTLISPQHGLRIGFDLLNSDGTLVFRSFHDDNPESVMSVQPTGRHHLTALIPGNLLKPGRYILQLTATIHMIEWITLNQLSLAFQVQHSGGPNSAYFDHRPGILLPLIPWTHEERVPQAAH